MRSYPIPALTLLLSFSALGGQSVITARLGDSDAIYVSPPAYRVHADGKTDDSPAIHDDFRKILVGNSSQKAVSEIEANLFGVPDASSHPPVSIPQWRQPLAPPASVAN